MNKNEIKFISTDLENKVIEVSYISAKEFNKLTSMGYIIRIVNPVVAGSQIKFIAQKDSKYPRK